MYIYRFISHIFQISSMPLGQALNSSSCLSLLSIWNHNCVAFCPAMLFACFHVSFFSLEVLGIEARAYPCEVSTPPRSYIDSPIPMCMCFANILLELILRYEIYELKGKCMCHFANKFPIIVQFLH